MALNPATASWIQGLSFAGILAALGILIRTAAAVGKIQLKVDTMWDWWLHEVTHLPAAPAKRPGAAKQGTLRSQI